jgi:hypothetical protein
MAKATDLLVLRFRILYHQSHFRLDIQEKVLEIRFDTDCCQTKLMVNLITYPSVSRSCCLQLPDYQRHQRVTLSILVPE